MSASKLRPALVLADAGRGDWLLCQITSKAYADSQAVVVDQSDFMHGSLQRISYARPAKLFTAHETLITATAGQLTSQALDRVTEAVVAIVRPTT